MEVPFKNSEEAFFWAVSTHAFRTQAITPQKRFTKYERPCSYEDILIEIKRLNLNRSELETVMKYGESLEKPDEDAPLFDRQIWDNTLSKLNEALVRKKIVVPPTEWMDLGDKMTKTYIKTSTGTVEADKIETPPNRIFREAWQLEGDVIDIDMPRARDIWRDKIREARAKAFEPLDNLYRQKTEELIPAQALEQDVSALVDEIEQITAQKQALRDATNDPAIEAAQTVEELKAVQPAGLVIE